MNVTVMSRRDAIRYCRKPNDARTAIISISDPYMAYSDYPFISKSNGVVGILYLTFSDADGVGLPDVYGRPTMKEDLMSDDDAKKIAIFLRAHENDNIIVHCDAGISRSSGVTAAILKYKTGDDSSIFKNGRYCPNMWCYRKTLEALMREEESNERF